MSSKVKKDSLLGSDILESSLGTVPSAANANLLDGLDSGVLQKTIIEGTGISVDADTVGLDTTYTDARYLMAANVSQVCPTGYSLYRLGLCWQNPDVGNKTFTQAVTQCAGLNGRLPSYGELFAFGKLAIPGVSILSDWTGDMTGDDEAAYINNTAAGDNWDGVQAMSTPAFARCVTAPSIYGLQGVTPP